MKQFQKVFFPLIVTSIISATCFGQKDDDFLPGYVITNDRDSIPGLILSVDHKTGTRRCVYKKFAESSETTYQPGEIEAYGVGVDKYFYSHKPSPDDKAIFLECIVKGSVSLFVFDKRLFVKSPKGIDELIALREEFIRDGKSFHVDRPLYKATLQSALDDCPSISEKLFAVKLSQKDISDLFAEYYACTNEKVVVIGQEDRDKTLVRLGFGLGLISTSMNINVTTDSEYFIENDASNSVSFSPSILAEFSNPNNNKRLGVRTGLSYKVMKHKIHDESELIINNTIKDLSIESTCLELPVLVKFNLSKKSDKLYLMGGMGANVLLKWYDRFVSTTSSGYVLSDKENELDHNTFYFGFSLGGGFSTSVGKHKLFFESLYNINPMVLKGKSNYPAVTYNTLRFQVGMFF